MIKSQKNVESLVKINPEFDSNELKNAKNWSKIMKKCWKIRENYVKNGHSGVQKNVENWMKDDLKCGKIVWNHWKLDKNFTNMSENHWKLMKIKPKLSQNMRKNCQESLKIEKNIENFKWFF